MACPMDGFVGARRVVALGIAKGFDDGHLNGVVRDSVKGAISAMVHNSARLGKEALGAFDPPDGLGPRRGPGIIVRGKALDLLGIERRAIVLICAGASCRVRGRKCMSLGIRGYGDKN